jgi:ATP-dependent DNA ligase
MRHTRPAIGLWLKVKCLHREEFVVVGWTDPEGRRPYLGALLLAYYDPDGRLVYAGRVGTGIRQAELERLWRRLRPLATDKMPLEVAPPRASRFGSPLVMWREFLSPRARKAQILWFVASQGFLRRFHRRVCKTGFARRALAGKGMRCARSVEGVDLYKRWSMATGRPEPREAVSCCASSL